MHIPSIPNFLAIHQRAENVTNILTVVAIVGLIQYAVQAYGISSTMLTVAAFGVAALAVVGIATIAREIGWVHFSFFGNDVEGMPSTVLGSLRFAVAVNLTFHIGGSWAVIGILLMIVAAIEILAAASRPKHAMSAV